MHMMPEPMYGGDVRQPSVQFFNVMLVRQHIMTHDELENSMSSHPHNQISAHGGPGPRFSPSYPSEANGDSLNRSYSSFGRAPDTAKSPYVEDTQDSWLTGLNAGMRTLRS